MRVSEVEGLLCDSPIIRLATIPENIIAASANRILRFKPYFVGIEKPEMKDRPGTIFNLSSTSDFCVHSIEGGLIFIQNIQNNAYMPPIQIYGDDDTESEIGALRVIDRYLLVGANRFVLVIDLKRMCREISDSQKDSRALHPIALAASWGMMHGLHSDQVSDVHLNENLDRVISTGRDGLICVADISQMDPINPAIVRDPNKFNHDTCDIAENLLVMCMAINSPIRQLVIFRKVYIVIVTDTHETAIYKFGCLERADSEEFMILKESNREALDLGWRRLLEDQQDIPEINFDEGIVDIACLIASPSQESIYAILTHSLGGAAIVEISRHDRKSNGKLNTDVRIIEKIENLGREYVRSAAYFDSRLMLGTDSGRIFLEDAPSARHTRKIFGAPESRKRFRFDEGLS